MELLKKAVTVNEHAVYDVNMLLSRTPVAGKGCYVDINTVLQFESSPPILEKGQQCNFCQIL